MSVNRLLAAGAAILGLGALLVGARTGLPGGPAEITALDVARALRRAPDSIHILDVRSHDAFEDFHLPRAVHLPVQPAPTAGGAFAVDEWLPAFADLDLPTGELTVLAGDPKTPTRELWLAVRRSGRQAYFMPDAVGDWVDSIVSPVRAPTADPVELTRWSEIASLSRYFGGLPRVVDRPRDPLDTATRLTLARRRGCAF